MNDNGLMHVKLSSVGMIMINACETYYNNIINDTAKNLW